MVQCRVALLVTLVTLAGARPPAARAAAPEAVTIMRDAWGVPHIFDDGPRSVERGAYAAGYAQAQDRLFQMDILRRAATGRLAEQQVTGASYLLMDRVVRRDGFTHEERLRFFRRLSRQNRRAIEAYRDGVNAWIEKVTLDPMLLPFEFVSRPPAPWEVTDTVAIAQLEIGVFGSSGGEEVLNAEILLDLLDRFPEAEARGIFDDLYWLDDPSAPTTIEGAKVTDPDRVERFAPAQLGLLRTYAASIRSAAVSLRAEQGLLGGLGGRLAVPVPLHRHASNAIVIGPSLSASGHPILLGGPQTGLNAPSFFWEVGLHGAQYEAEGVNAPLGPGVLIGRGRNFAMTITSGILDNVDTYVEVLDPKDPNRYLVGRRSRPFERRTETIGVYGQPAETLEVLRTIHGPVFFIDREAGVAFSRRAAFRGTELDTGAALVSMGFVQSLRQFRRLADRVTASLNLHYADTRGNIAYFHRGIRPLRPRHTDPRLPLDGRGKMEWRGLLQPRALPSTVNPARGFITNWNNKPVAGWSAGEQRELWGVVDRVQVFLDALEAARGGGTKLSADDVKALMQRAATSDIFAARVLPFLESAVAALDQSPTAPLPAAVGRVRAWVDAGAPLVAEPDRNGTIPYPGAAIYREFRTALQMVFSDELGTAFRGMVYPATNEGNQEDDHGSLFSPDALLLRALFAGGAVPGAPAPAGMLPVSRNYFDDVTHATAGTRDAALVVALTQAVTTLTTRFGTDQTLWLLPALLETYRDLGAIGLFFGATVMERENRGSFNMVVDFDDPPRGEIIVPPGQSGTFTANDIGGLEPPHLRDQLPLYEGFRYRRQPFTVDELEAPVTVETIPVVRH